MIVPSWDFRLEVENISDSEVDAKTKEEAETLFDLCKNHLLHARLLKVRTNAHVLLITMHHIISDS